MILALAIAALLASASALAAPAGLTVYGNQGSRSPLVNWYLHEIGQEFTFVDVARVDRSSPEYVTAPLGRLS